MITITLDDESFELTEVAVALASVADEFSAGFDAVDLVDHIQRLTESCETLAEMVETIRARYGAAAAAAA